MNSLVVSVRYWYMIAPLFPQTEVFATQGDL